MERSLRPSSTKIVPVLLEGNRDDLRLDVITAPRQATLKLCLELPQRGGDPLGDVGDHAVPSEASQSQGGSRSAMLVM